MDRQMTHNQERIYELRRNNRLSFQEIGRILGITRQTVHESYNRALAYIHDLNNNQDLPEGVSVADLYRAQELDYIEGVIERYMRISDTTEDKQPRTAVMALDGAHKYFDSLIKLKGIAAPLQVHHVISNGDLERELLKVKSELGEIVEEPRAELPGTAAA